MTTTGQFGVVRTNGIAGWVIRLGTRSQVNHAFVVVSDHGAIVEAQPGGARISHLSKYPDAILSHYDLTHGAQVRIANAALDLKGTPYNWLDIAAITLLSLGFRFRWLQNRAQSSKTLICSQLVDRAYTNAGLHLYADGRPDGQVTPGDLLLLLAQRSERTTL